MHNNELNQIEYLLCLALDDEISKEQIQTLNSLLIDRPERIRFAVKYLQVYSFLKQSNKVADMGLVHGVAMDSNIAIKGMDFDALELDSEDRASQDSGITPAMLELLEMERTAPAIEVQEPDVEKPQLSMFDKNRVKSVKHPGPSKFQIGFVLTIAASFLLVVGYLHFFAPTPVDGPIVATLVDSIDAEWDTHLNTPEYDEMFQGRYFLKKGYASIQFDDGANVTLEAPTEVSLYSGGNMELTRGQIYAVVPARAQGFTVKAGNSNIVDLGTEFGVALDESESVQLHVTKGQTILFTGSQDGSNSKIDVKAGSGKKVYNDGFVKDIDLNPTMFVQKIDSDVGLVWNGQRNLGPSGDGLIFSESFESPVVQGYAEESVPAGWIGAAEGFGAKNRGLFNEGDFAVFSTPYGRQAYLLDYTNSGLTTSQSALNEVLTAGTTYSLTFNAAYIKRITDIIDPNSELDLKFKPAYINDNESEFCVELVVFEPGENRQDW